MTEDEKMRRELWRLSLDSVLPNACESCKGVFDAIEQFSWLPLSSDGEMVCESTASFHLIQLELHSSSRLFSEVFDSRTSLTEGLFQGKCPECGRWFKYMYQPKSGDPGTLSVGRSHSWTKQPSAREAVPPEALKLHPKPQVKTLSTPDTVAVIERTVTSSTEREAHYSNALAGPPPGSRWSEGIDHRWTVHWDDNVSFEKIRMAPETVWVQTHRPAAERFRPDVTVFHHDTGDTLNQWQNVELLALNANVALILKKSGSNGLVGLDSYSGKRLWELEERWCRGSLSADAVVVACPDGGHLVSAPLLDAGRRLGEWRNLSEPGEWKVESVSSWGTFWVINYRGPGRRFEVRNPVDLSVLWSGVCASYEQVYVTPDPHGWVVQRDRDFQVYDHEARCVHEFSGPELISMGPRFIVGQYPMGEGSLWGCAEPGLVAYNRWSGVQVPLPREAFQQRRCYGVSGDVLWCVCENETVLRGYDLSGGRVVKEFKPLPLPEAQRRRGGIQAIRVYGKSLYVPSKAGSLMKFGPPT